MRNITELNMNNRYLPKKIGIEVESFYDLMQWAERNMPMFDDGNSESNRIYEAKTVPTDVQNPIEVALLGEVTRRCIPNYTKGGSDAAACSAHCHASLFNTEISIDQMELLMFGLMPFMSMTWCRNNYDTYTFRSTIVGEGSCYGRFLSVTHHHSRHANYTERSTWVKDQSGRWGKNSFEFRANENSPLWIYLITTLLTDSDIIKKLTAVLNSKMYKDVADAVERGGNRANLSIFDSIIRSTSKYIIPRLLSNMENIVSVMPAHSRKFMKKLLTAYLLEDEDEYNKLMNLIIESDDSISATFKKLDAEVEEYAHEFDVVKEIK